MSEIEFKDVRCAEGIKIRDISTEYVRTYIYPDGHEIRIGNPIALRISSSGSHYVVDQRGIVHYIANGWTHLWWGVHNHADHISF